MSNNGILSFGAPFYDYIPRRFPHTYFPYPLIAPYWTDVDLRWNGNVIYGVYTAENGSFYIDQLYEFLSNTGQGSFTASMIVVAQWIDVCPYSNSFCSEVSNNYQLIS